MALKDYISRNDLKTVTGLGLLAWLFTFGLDLLILGELSTDIRYYVLKYVGFFICIVLAYQFKLKSISPRDNYWWVFLLAYPLIIFVNASGTNIVTKQLGEYGLEAVFKIKADQDSLKRQMPVYQQPIPLMNQAGFNIFRFLSLQNSWWPDVHIIKENNNLTEELSFYQNKLKKNEDDLAILEKQLEKYRTNSIEQIAADQRNLASPERNLASIKKVDKSIPYEQYKLSEKSNDSLTYVLKDCKILYEKCLEESKLNEGMKEKNDFLENNSRALEGRLKALVFQIEKLKSIQSKYETLKQGLPNPAIKAEDRFRKIMLNELGLIDYIKYQDSLLEFPLYFNYK